LSPSPRIQICQSLLSHSFPLSTECMRSKWNSSESSPVSSQAASRHQLALPSRKLPNPKYIMNHHGTFNFSRLTDIAFSGYVTLVFISLWRNNTIYSKMWFGYDLIVSLRCIFRCMSLCVLHYSCLRNCCVCK
jgi:hypothetical protein